MPEESETSKRKIKLDEKIEALDKNIFEANKQIDVYQGQLSLADEMDDGPMLQLNKSAHSSSTSRGRKIGAMDIAIKDRQQTLRALLDHEREQLHKLAMEKWDLVEERRGIMQKLRSPLS